MTQPRDAAAPARPNAAATVEARGRRNKVPRDYVIKILLDVNGAEHADASLVTSIARKALAGFPPDADEADRRRFEPVSSRGTKPVVIAVEGTAACHGRPDDASIQALRVALLDGGYRVTVRETRECTQPECSSDTMVEWNRPAFVPPGWHASQICGKHDFKTCGRCRSVYLMTSYSAAGQAPSVSCEVCGGVMIEWGSTKVWSAELVTRGE
ncbi:MAG TPA: hypothetical protein VFF06_03805 [Polyangia bacterium]|nr:hypothetical protein [Polyangia bacterium]